MTFSFQPLSLIYSAIGVVARANAVSPIGCNLSNVFNACSPPAALNLAALFEDAQEVFGAVPEIEPLAMKQILLEETVVVLSIGKYL
jgi:hypothetical protein